MRQYMSILAATALFAASAVWAAEPPAAPPGGASILTWTPAQQAYGYRNMEKIGRFNVVRRGAKVRQLITRTSGVKWNEDYEDLGSDVAKVGLTAGEPGMNPVVSYMRHLPREAEPGTKFVYNTGQTDLAGILVSNATGKPLAQYLSEKIWAPFGMEQDAIWIEDAAGHERGGCCMSMTLRDYGRLGLFMLEGGKAGGRPVVPAGWVADATSAHVQKHGYGFFWWMIPGGY